VNSDSRSNLAPAQKETRMQHLFREMRLLADQCLFMNSIKQNARLILRTLRNLVSY
jgi:hypothetical protein